MRYVTVKTRLGKQQWAD